MEKTKYSQSISLLQSLIKIPSLSGNEDKTAKCLKEHLHARGVKQIRQKFNNIWVQNQYYDNDKPTILLNSHHDTVSPSKAYSNDPHEPKIIDGKLYGLGSNDAGGPLVSLLATFCHYYHSSDLPWNLIFAATGEEESSGEHGIACILDEIGPIDLAIVGEPTSMDMAVAEKGLMVLDCEYQGIPGHAGHGSGVNAIYKALKDIKWFQNYEFNKVSDSLGKVLMNVTQINSGVNHNVIPDRCEIVVDVRCTDEYRLEDLLNIITDHTEGIVRARSMKLKPSKIDLDHPVVEAGIGLGLKTYGSPTMSDQAFMPFPSIKIGPGDSIRSHTADEFIYVDQIEQGIDTYIQLLKEVKHLDKFKELTNETVG